MQRSNSRRGAAAGARSASILPPVTAVLLALGLLACGAESPVSANNADSVTETEPEQTNPRESDSTEPDSVEPDPAGDTEPAEYTGGPQQIVEGDSCSGHGEDITDQAAFSREGQVWSRQQRWGCGCARGPVFTMVVEPGTSPLRARLCEEYSADPCDMPCGETLSWDLSSHVSADGSVEFVEPVR